MTPFASNENKLFPGMGCAATEFFISNNEMKIIHNSRILPFCEISFETQDVLEKEIENNPEVKSELLDMFPDSKFKRLEQFAKCRFGGLDFEGDIKDGILQDGEYWDCPNHGKCKSEGILCKLPSYNNQRLTAQDIDLIKLTSTDLTNEAIASRLAMALGSFHKHKKILYKKLAVQTKQEIAKIAVSLNIIQL